jgi:hypothetical protein
VTRVAQTTVSETPGADGQQIAPSALRTRARNQRHMNGPSEGSETVARVALIGYARVATVDQNPQLQHDALERAGCERLVDHAFGARDEGPEFARALDPPAGGRHASRVAADAVLALEMALMLPTMIAVMVVRLDEYAGHPHTYAAATTRPPCPDSRVFNVTALS